jgi:hypothetical protein
LDEARVAYLQDVREDVRRFTGQAATNNFMPVFEDYNICADGLRDVIRLQPSPADPIRKYVDEVRFLKALGLHTE